MTSLIGRNLGIYEIRDVIGHGGMASVYLGYRADVDRSVAIKVLPPHPGLNEDAMQRFQLEARTIANLQHPHILPLYDYGATEDGVLYLVMPYVRGGSLDRIIRDGKLTVEKVMRTVREISGALDYAHRQGVIHRDIKPANILLDGEGNALLADFGIVKLAGGESNLTGTGVVGTPAYMSPEQAQGFELTARADLYSFGVVIYELLSGQLPFTSESVMNLMLKHITDPVPDLTSVLPSLPRALNAVMRKVLAKDASERYPTASAFNDAFQKAIQTSSDDSHPAARVTAEMPADPGDYNTIRMDEKQQGTNTPPPPIQIQLGKGTVPITLPIDALDPNRPGTIVIQSPTQTANNTPLFVAFGAVALIAVAALVIVLLSLNNRNGDVVATAVATLAGAPTIEPTIVARVNLEPTFGRASFSSSADDKMGDSVNLRVQDFSTAPSGKAYVASLVNTISGERLNLGRMNVDAVGSGALGFTDPDGRFLPTLYNAIDITLEDNPDEPAFTDVRYSAMLPVGINDVMSQIFVASEDGFRGKSLIQSAAYEARFATQHAGLAAGADNTVARHVHNEHTLNILLGGKTDYDGDGRGLNPGTGVGLMTFLDRIDAAISTVADTPGAPVSVQSQAELVRVCLQNVRNWSNEIITYEQSMLLEEDMTLSQPDAEASNLIAQKLMPGIDENENGIVEPYEGECGLDQVTTFGLVVASFDLYEGAFDDGTGQ